MLPLIALAVPTEPLLGADGWTWLGPLPPGRDPARDVVVLDPRRCAPALARRWLDAGPDNRDLQLVRVWEGAWRWADDWSVSDGTLVRPGRAAVPLPAALVIGPTSLAVDGAGRVVARTTGGRRVEILRDESGAFQGMRSGEAWVRLNDGATAGASDGRTISWREEAGELRAFVDEFGSTTVYVGTPPRAVRWPDGTGVDLEAAADRLRIVGAGGIWSCASASGRTQIDGPTGRWIVESRPDGEVVTDPAGGVVRVWTDGGRLAGWADPRGGQTRIVRAADGRVEEVDDPSGARWSFEWDSAALVEVTAPPAAPWTLGHVGGAWVRLSDPSGRISGFERDTQGRLRGVRRGAALRSLARDSLGRITELGDETGSTVRLRRDERGRVGRVLDGAGGAWLLARDDAGRITVITDPGGASWKLGRDRAGRVRSVEDATGRTTAWTRREDARPAGVYVGGRRWEFLWNIGGHL